LFTEWISRHIKTSLLPKELSKETLKLLEKLLTELRTQMTNYWKRFPSITAEKISEHHRIIGFRNILIHGYDIVDEAIVWQAVTNHLPILIREIKEILST